MSSFPPPPPLPASDAAGDPPPPRPLPSGPPGHPGERPSGDDPARGARSLANWSLGCTVLAAVCCGGGAFAGVRAMETTAVRARAELDDAQRVQQSRSDAAALLESLAEDLSAGAAELPPTLPEAPPKDPWGRPVRYQRRGPASATLTSAGPDGSYGTADDVTRDVKIR